MNTYNRETLRNPGEAALSLKNAGFSVKERLNGMYVTGYNATKNGVTYICAHVGMGAYPQERIDAVLNQTAPISE